MGRGVAERLDDGHVRGLTGLRGVAAGWVLLLHALQFGGGTSWPLSIGGWTFDPGWLAGCGYFGVDLFFVLSGFLLSLPYHRAAAGEREWPSLKRFWLHRVRRVLPAYWLQLLVLVIGFAWLGQHGRIEPLNVVGHVLLVQNLLPEAQLLNPVYWSMPVEWDFYVVLPLIALLLTRASGWLVALLALVWAISFRLLCYLSWFDPALAEWISYPNVHQLPARIDQFFAGVLAAWLLVRRPGWLVRPDWWLWAGIAGVLAMVVAAGPRGDFLIAFDAPYLFFHHSLLAIAFAMVVVGVAAGSRWGRRLFAGPVLVWTGLVSYSLYLWHYIVLQVVNGSVPLAAMGLSPMQGVLLVSVPLALLVAWLSYRFVERPFLESRGR